MHFYILNISTKQFLGDQKKQLNGKGSPTKSTVVKAKPTPAKPAKSGSYKLVVKSPMPTRAAKSSRTRPTAVQILLSKITPTTASKATASLVKNGKSAAAKTNGNNGNGKANGAKANGKADAKPTAQARLNGNGKVVIEKKVIGNAKYSSEKKSSGNGKVTVVTKSSVAVEKKAGGNGKATVQVKEIKIKVNGKPQNKVIGEAKANGGGKIITVVEKKVTNGAASRAKIETTTRAKTEKVVKTVVSTAKSATKLEASKAAKPTKASKLESTTLTKASKAAAAGKSQARAEVKEVTQVKTVVTKVPVVKTTVSKAAKSVVERVSVARKVASTSLPVRPTPPRPTKPKMAVDINVKSQHKPFPPFGKTALRGTSVPARKVTSGYQQVQRRGPGPAQYGPSVPLWSGLSTIKGVQQNVSGALHAAEAPWCCWFWCKSCMVGGLDLREEAGSYEARRLRLCLYII